jgi:hypothetical protein
MVHCTRIYQANVNDCCQNTTIRCLVGYSTVHHPSGWIMDSWCAEPLRLRSEVPILNVECCLVGTFQASSGEKIRHSAERSRLPSDTVSKKCNMLLRARRIFFFSFSFAFREKTRYYQGCYFRLLFLPFFEFFEFTPKDVAPSGKNNAAHKWTFYKAQYFCIVRPKRTVRFFSDN